MSMTLRTDVSQTIPVEIVDEIIRDVQYQSVVLSMGTRARNLREREEDMPLLDSVVQAGFVSDDTGRIPLTKLTASTKRITAKKIGAIAVVPRDLLEDSTRIDLWGELRRQLPGAFGRRIDLAVLIGTGAPAGWPSALLTEAAARSAVVDLSNTIGAGNDLYDAILGVSGVFDLVARDGHMVTGVAIPPRMEAQLRGLRGTDGHPVFAEAKEGGTIPATLAGAPLRTYKGALGSSNLMIAGEWEYLRYAWRREIEFAVADQATLVDEFGGEVINLFQQDSVAIRATARLGWNWFSPYNDENTNNATRFPWAALVD